MKTILKSKFIFIAVIGLTSIVSSCKESKTDSSKTLAVSDNKPKMEALGQKTTLTRDFSDYWYAGEAEITSYKLEQARYGEIREGKAVLVFVTEDFLPNVQVKADNYSESNTPILKLNATKNFNTGIYPYSIMQSTYYPVANNQHALKISSSVQEWCGHVYTQLNNREKFEIMSHSYFQSEADQSFNLKKSWTENELWTKLRIDPKSLPIGEISCIPSLEHTSLRHKTIKGYNAIASLNHGTYTLSYPELNRTLAINFNVNFPYDILGWEETTVNGYGTSAQTMTSKATKLKTIKSAYWNKNHNGDEGLRETLKLQ